MRIMAYSVFWVMQDFYSINSMNPWLSGLLEGGTIMNHDVRDCKVRFLPRYYSDPDYELRKV